MTNTFGILLFPEAEELDFAGPYEVFGMFAKHFDQDWQVTAAGVSAGIDMALYVVGLLKSPDVARNVQKAIEYYPEPPFAEEAALSAGKETA